MLALSLPPLASRRCPQRTAACRIGMIGPGTLVFLGLKADDCLTFSGEIEPVPRENLKKIRVLFQPFQPRLESVIFRAQPALLRPQRSQFQFDPGLRGRVAA